MEDKIRRLCSELLAKEGDEDFGPIMVELRDALHQHIERLREHFAGDPFVAERRIRKDVAPPNQVENKAAAKETKAEETSLGHRAS